MESIAKIQRDRRDPATKENKLPAKAQQNPKISAANTILVLPDILRAYIYYAFKMSGHGIEYLKYKIKASYCA